MESITPERLARCGTESGHQQALMCWCNQQVRNGKYPMLRWIHSIPNGGLRNKVTASRLKAEGVKKGVSDVFLPYPVIVSHSIGGGVQWCHGLYIEMKKPGKGRLSIDQQNFIADMYTEGYATAICNTWEEAARAIVKYLPAPR